MGKKGKASRNKKVTFPSPDEVLAGSTVANTGNVAPPSKKPTLEIQGQEAAYLLPQDEGGSKVANTVVVVRDVPEKKNKAETVEKVEAKDSEVVGQDEEGGDDEDGDEQKITMVHEDEIPDSPDRTIATLKAEIEEIAKEIVQRKEEEKLAKEFFSALDDPVTLEKLYSDPKKKTIKEVIGLHEPTDVLEEKLRNHVANLRERLLVSERRLEAREMSLINALNAERIQKLSSKKKDTFQSGIVYIEDKCRIEIHDASNDIGILIKDSYGTVRRKDDIQVLDLSTALEEACKLREMDFATESVREQFCNLVPSLSKRDVKNACNVLIDEYDLDDACKLGEMTFQQVMCTPFSKLLMAAAGEKGFVEPSYKADQYVQSSLLVQRKPKNHELEMEKTRLKMKPDSAATLYAEWDAFAIMEIKPEHRANKEDHLIDNDRCVLMTAVTATVVRDCIEQKDYGKVLLPFLIYTGHFASLYVTGLTDEGNPVVYLVGYPGDTNSQDHVLNKSPCIERTTLFIVFAVLLNNFKSFFETSVKGKYMEKFKERILPLEKFPVYALTERTTGRDKVASNTDTSDSSSRREGSRCTHEQYAKEAAECGGVFRDVVNPFDVFLDLTGNCTKDGERTVSPFYFRGRLTSSRRDAFLKVWKADEVDIDSVAAEWQCHNQAFKSGVPVAEPVLSELTRSTCSRGFVYLVFAVEFINEDIIATIEDLWHFSCSLIQAVLMLHHNANLLHCDIKRANLLWKRNGIRLIDFEHAQEVSNPGFAPGTRGYQAPEVLDQQPCSTKTDAFAVGKTISRCLSAFKEENLSSTESKLHVLLNEVSLRLTDLHPDSRWSLSEALLAIQDSKERDSQTKNVVSFVCPQPSVLASRLVPP